MIDQRENILERKWKHLIVLDACRYDYFADMYSDYLSGGLEKADSPVSCESGVATSEWCKAVFTDRYDDIVYVSTTPHVNSKTEVNGFKASKHFHKVIDVWDWGWNDEKGTVLPGKVNEALLEARERFPEKRIISHYMQPHFPYLSLDNPSRPKSKEPKEHDTLKRNVRNFFGSKIRRVLGGDRTRKIMDFLGLSPVNPMHETLQKIGKEGLLDAYEENLKEVLKAVSDVSRELSGKIIVTSDHGEYLGEKGFYGHSYLPNRPVLNHVPWLEMRG